MKKPRRPKMPTVLGGYLRYVLVLLIAGFWMLFFDRYNLVSQQKMQAQIQELKAARAYYEAQIQTLDFEAERLKTDPDEMERYARERYHMHLPGEDVYVIMRQEEVE